MGRENEYDPSDIEQHLLDQYDILTRYISEKLLEYTGTASSISRTMMDKLMSFQTQLDTIIAQKNTAQIDEIGRIRNLKLVFVKLESIRLELDKMGSDKQK